MLHLGDAISVFQSTLSMRRATILYRNSYTLRNISIHALHEESDQQRCYNMEQTRDFNPRSP